MFEYVESCSLETLELIRSGRHDNHDESDTYYAPSKLAPVYRGSGWTPRASTKRHH
jgi:hypothetical protein